MSNLPPRHLPISTCTLTAYIEFIASGVLRGVLTRTDVWAYRIPFALQWFWPVPLIIGVFLAPESPWWLIRHDRPEEAKKALLRLTSHGDESFNADETIAMMSYTNQIEKQMSEGTTYAQCFRGVDLRRTEIACLTWLCQAMCGSSIQSFSTYFYEQAGLTTAGAFDLSLGQYALGIVGTLGSWFLMSWFGRRTLYVARPVCAVHHPDGGGLRVPRASDDRDRLGNRQLDSHLHVCLRRHHRPRVLRYRCGNFLHLPEGQDYCAGTESLQHRRDHQQRAGQLHDNTQAVRLGLGRQGRLLLRRPMPPMHPVVLLPPARAERSLVCRAGYPLRAQDPRAPVCQDKGRYLQSE